MAMNEHGKIKMQAKSGSNLEMMLAMVASDQADPFGNSYLRDLFEQINSEVEFVNQEQKQLQK